MNPREGERAVLIKNRQGDWGIVLGKWKGMSKGVPGVAGKFRGLDKESEVKKVKSEA